MIFNFKSSNKRLHKSFLTLTLIALSLQVQAQAPKPPLPVELMFGHEKLNFQVMVNKSFTPESRFGFFSVASYSTPYDDFSEVSISMPMHIYYIFWKRFSVIGGASVSSGSGFSPTTGFSHNYVSQKFLTITKASFNLNSSNDFILFGIYEYKPPSCFSQ